MLNYPARLYTQYETNVGYFACRSSKDTHLRYGPSPDAPVKQFVRATKRVGVQSTRNPDGSSTPPCRPARNGFVWVFVLDGGESGWVDQEAIRHDDETADLRLRRGPPVPAQPPRQGLPTMWLGRMAMLTASPCGRLPVPRAQPGHRGHRH